MQQMNIKRDTSLSLLYIINKNKIRLVFCKPTLSNTSLQVFFPYNLLGFSDYQYLYILQKVRFYLNCSIFRVYCFFHI